MSVHWLLRKNDVIGSQWASRKKVTRDYDAVFSFPIRLSSRNATVGAAAPTVPVVSLVGRFCFCFVSKEKPAASSWPHIKRNWLTASQTFPNTEGHLRNEDLSFIFFSSSWTHGDAKKNENNFHFHGQIIGAIRESIRETVQKEGKRVTGSVIESSRNKW